MTDLPSSSLQLDSFALRITDIRQAALPALHALSLSVGWPHRAEDWQIVLQLGRGIAALDDIGRVLGSAMWFPQEDGFATVGMVITSPRLQAQGAGQTLMRYALRELDGYDLGLNSTRAAKRLYLSMGFQPEATVYQCQGEAVAPPALTLPAGCTLRRLTEADLPALSALDRAAWGAGRAGLLAQLMALSEGVGLFREGALSAFALCRPFGRGHVVGPLVAPDAAEAIAVFAPHVAAHAGRFLRIDTREGVGPFAEFVARCGLGVFDTVTTMSLGRPWLARPGKAGPRSFGLVSQTFG